jgi:hypothetical protein
MLVFRELEIGGGPGLSLPLLVLTLAGVVVFCIGSELGVMGHLTKAIVVSSIGLQLGLILTIS